MPSLLSRYQQDVSSAHSRAIPAALIAASILAYIGTHTPHYLLTSAVAWTVLCLYTTFFRLGETRSERRIFYGSPNAWSAGALFALGRVCERAVEVRGIWWAKCLLPVLIYFCIRGEILGTSIDGSDSPPASPDKSRNAPPVSESKSSLAILTGSAIVAVATPAGTNANLALGLSYTILQVFAFLLVERARSDALQNRHMGRGSVIYSANGLLTQPLKPSGSGGDVQAAVVRDVSIAAAIATSIAAFTLEDFKFDGLAQEGGDAWVDRQGVSRVLLGFAMVATNTIADGTLLLMIQLQGTLRASLAPFSAAVASQLIVAFSSGRLWFAALCAVSTFTFLDEQEIISLSSSAGVGRMRIRYGRIITLIAIVSFGVLTIQSLWYPLQLPNFPRSKPPAPVFDGLSTAFPTEPLAPLPFTNSRVHPVDQLVRDAEAQWLQAQTSQSKTLEQAVTEYRRRYGLPPPPNFDKWFQFAKRKGVELIDEYDSIYHSLLPFWALSPSTIRARAREALGFAPNMLMALLIRDGKAKHVEAGQEWLQDAVVGMIKDFVQYLPDMDLAFNVHDEPRVVVPHDELSQLVHIALSQRLPEAFANPTPRNSFSAKPKDIGGGRRLFEVKTTRFNVFAHQPVWLPSCLSCSPASAARSGLDDDLAADNLTSYALGELGFVYNHTAFSDICNSPSLGSTHGFFDRPNAFNVVHDLFPIFSQSKMSSFQDILYPSPWYWYGKVEYNEMKDMDWQTKINALYWRGSTTGGFSRDGGWRRQHRQHMIQKLNALDKAKILENVHEGTEDETNPEWKAKEVAREDFKAVMDVRFSHVGQCDPGDCDAQKEFFGPIAPSADQQDAWKYRYLLDMDGNAFSGRFYAFLKSHSLTFKMAVFREWHEEWIKPWVHYIPLSLRAEDALESVRYFSHEAEGKKTAIRIAEAGREWADKALRNDDFEVWLFRLLLEYGRLVDDNRANIGFAGS